MSDRPQPPVTPPYARPVLRGRSRRPQHRRRRGAALALLGLLVVAGIVGVLGTAGNPLAHPHRRGGAARAGIRRRPSRSRSPRPLAAAVEAARENAALNRTLTYTPFVRIAGAQHREAALTFDDGPGPYTPAVLRVLERWHVPATFFEIGVLEPYFHASTTSIVAAGDVIGDHTQSHAPMSGLSKRDQRAQLLQDTATIGNFGAPFPRLFRPPYGLWNRTTLSLLHQYRMLMVLWTVDTEDYRLPGVRAIVDRAVRGVRPGAIILLHDAGGNRSETVAALPSIIRQLRARGYRLVTVPRLLLDNPAPRDQNVAALAGAGG